METDKLKILAVNAAAIAKETGDKLSKFDKKTAKLFYSNISLFIKTEELGNLIENPKNEKRFKTFQEEIKKISTQASEYSRQKAEEMAKIIIDGNKKIKSLYENIC